MYREVITSFLALAFEKPSRNGRSSQRISSTISESLRMALCPFHRSFEDFLTKFAQG